MPHKPKKKKHDPRGDPFGGHHVSEPQYPKGQGVPRPRVGTENLGSGHRQEAEAKRRYNEIEEEIGELSEKINRKSKDMNVPPSAAELKRIRALRNAQRAAKKLGRF